MSAAAFALAAWVFLGLEIGLKDAIALGPTHIAPSFVFCFLTFIAMFAPQPRPVWAALALGLLMDLTFRIPLRDGAGTATVIGPYALSYALACQLIVALRGIVIKRNPLTLGFLAMLGNIVAQVVLVGIFTFRIWLGDAFEWHPTAELMSRLGCAMYTGMLGVLLALVLIPSAAFFGLPTQVQRRFAKRM